MSLKFDRVEKARIIRSTCHVAVRRMTKVVMAGAATLLVCARIAPAQFAHTSQPHGPDLADRPDRRTRRRWHLPAAVAGVALLAGCSTLSLGYGQGVNLATWWLDRYVGFNDDQKPRLRVALQDWMAWHRSQALADDIALLEQAAREVRQDTTPAQVCAWWDRFTQRRTLYLTQLLPAATELAATLEPRQLESIQARQASKNADWRDDHLQAKPAERLAGDVERVRDRAEMLYGKLDSEQRRYLVERQQGATPWDAERWFSGMVRDQSALLQALRAVAGTTPGTPAAADARQQLADTLLRPGATADAATKAWRQQLLTYQCTVGAELHNRTNAEQRETAARTLRGWAQDLRGHVLPAAATRRPSLTPAS